MIIMAEKDTIARKKALLKIRKKAKSRKPAFIRQEGWRHSRLKQCWRKPKGRHSKLARHKRCRGHIPSPGYQSPVLVRGLNPRGRQEVRIFSPADVEKLDPSAQDAVIASSVGGRKRAEIVIAAAKKGIVIVNG